MKREAAEALWASAEAWHNKLSEPNPNKISAGTNECPCCRLFFSAKCQGCPIAEAAGAVCCEDTPYPAASSALDTFTCDPNLPNLKKWLKTATAEYQFLIELACEAEIDDG